MDNVLDLDALIPPTATIRFNNQEITVNPPKTGDLLRLGTLGRKLENIDNLSEEQTEQAINHTMQAIRRLIPELGGADLNSQQLIALMNLIGKMITPPETKELEDKGITPVGGDTDPKD